MGDLCQKTRSIKLHCVYIVMSQIDYLGTLFNKDFDGKLQECNNLRMIGTNKTYESESDPTKVNIVMKFCKNINFPISVKSNFFFSL